MRCKRNLKILCFVFFVAFLGSPICQSRAIGDVEVDVLVVDSLDQEPLSGAQVVLVCQVNETYEEPYVQVTDTAGYSKFLVPRASWYGIYAISDDPTTPGCDYVPSFTSKQLDQDREENLFILELLPGATIHAQDDAYLLDFSGIGDYFLFTVFDVLNGEPVSLPNSVINYGYGFRSYTPWPYSGVNQAPKILGLSSREIIVPSDVLVGISVKTLGGGRRAGWHAQQFIMDNDGDYYNLAQGELVVENLGKYSLRENLIAAGRLLSSITELVMEASAAGFYTTLEKQDLARASNLLQTARESYQEKDYFIVHSYLRKAYIIAANVDSHMKLLFEDARSASLFAPIFFAVTAATLSFLLEDARRRLLLSFSAFTVFLISFYLLFPGSDFTNLATMSVISSLLLFSIYLVAPSFSAARSEKRALFVSQPPTRTLFGSTFSLAIRNLKRNRLRTILSSTSLTVLVFAFIALTSVSHEFGLLSLRQPSDSSLTEGLLIRRFGAVVNSEEPIPWSIVDWLRDRPGVQLVVPKLESVPSRYPLINFPDRHKTEVPIFGILGIFPSLEKNITGIQETIISGCFLEDAMTDAVLLSRNLADKLGLRVRDTLDLYDVALEVVGILDDQKLADTVDIDGNSILPQKLSVTPFMGLTAIDCKSDEVIITNAQTALLFSDMIVSRVDILLEKNEDIIGFAGLLVLDRGFDVWASTTNGIYYLRIGGGLESRGLVTVLPLLVMVVLSVAFHFIGNVRERRNEIFFMATLGVNPTQTLILFVAEAVVIGIIGGGVGYLAGSCSYRILSYFSADLMVRQKASIGWAVAGILLTLGTSVIASILPAIRASAIVTPSLRRKWSVRAQGTEQVDGTWVFTMPVKVPAATASFFRGFLEKRLRERSGKLADRVENLSISTKVEPDCTIDVISFRYISGEIEGEGFTIDDEISIIKKIDAEECPVRLKSRLVYLNIKAESRIHKNISFIRQLVLEWATLRHKIVTPEGYSLSHLYTLVKTFHPTTVDLIVFSDKAKRRITGLSARLHREGEPAPIYRLIRISGPNSHEENLEKVRNVFEDKTMTVVCVNGGPEYIFNLLKQEAAKKGIPTCCVRDDRPLIERQRYPFYVSRVVRLD